MLRLINVAMRKGQQFYCPVDQILRVIDLGLVLVDGCSVLELVNFCLGFGISPKISDQQNTSFSARLSSGIALVKFD